ncbi:exopolysaccharide biosynthesis protein [Prauserella shujinwangii]|uniref:exopolysaccharide biosynthesis protein n=1 Tax=Prauserella shujinwangii TaxID=1453103 RepID=UPI000D083E7B|nr:exopolysaccharide biosynthesis protein [Prauserella shujinwangii]
MSDDLVRLPVIGRLLRRRWRALLALAAVGALVGAGASLLFSPGYETTSSVLLQGPREEDELLTEAEIATSSVVLDRTASALGWGVPGQELDDVVEAAVLNGNVIEIRATAETPERAQRLADLVAEEYVAFSTQLVTDPGEASAQMLKEQREVLRQRVAQTNERITRLHESVAGQGTSVESVQARTQLEALRTSLEDAMTTLAEAEEASSRANMVVMGPAALSTEQAAPTMAQFVAGGAVVFVLLGIFGHLAAARADRRLRNEADIVAALGAPMVGSVDVPSGADPGARATGPLGRLRRVLGTDRPWNVPEPPAPADDAAVTVRYRRVLARFRGGPGSSRRVLVLVPDDDAPAGRAADRLLATNDRAANLELRLVRITAGRPTVPDTAGSSGALLVLTPGTRTAWELVGITEACAEAGQAVLGAVLTQPTARGDGSGQGPEPAATAPVHDGVMAGSA